MGEYRGVMVGTLGASELLLRRCTWAHSQPPAEAQLLPASSGPTQAVRPSWPLSPALPAPGTGKVVPNWAIARPGSACVTQTPGKCPHLSQRPQPRLGRPAGSHPARRASRAPRRNSRAGRFTPSDALISFDQLTNKYGPTKCRFYGYLQPRHFVNLRSNISQRKSSSRFLINYWKFKPALVQRFLSILAPDV